MSNVLPTVDDQFREIRDQVVARMIKDGVLLMYLNRLWHNNPPECADPECLSLISGVMRLILRSCSSERIKRFYLNSST